MTGDRALSEVEALARRAARGAGLPWGLADEAGRAVRGLALAEVDGCALLARLLAETAPRPHQTLAPARLDRGAWQAADGPLCPIRTGASLSDMARMLPAEGIALRQVLVPALILPFVGDMAGLQDGPVTLSWQGGIIGIGPEGLPRTAGIVKLVEVDETDLFLHPGGPALPAAPAAARARPSAAAWAALEALAARAGP
ncbi:DUF3726 domain-containing protein [Roseicyclus persicicus]|uniref:DUF3726 domain-containing protein n=1 Tax=Roseicyclus persicicus TaxID=2650661 RepID=A0A7X6GYM9_9RHOB|nr:DUF3726 domain-containing protein [Roseibacterium persicicum]NKX44791.1 DUF3726 domain-containing protein [Roseibacterium persicicum]